MRLTSSRCAYPCRWRKMAKDEICPDRFPRMGQMSRSGHQAEALGGRILGGINVQDRYRGKIKRSDRYSDPSMDELVSWEDQEEIKDGRDYSGNVSYTADVGETGRFSIDGFYVKTDREVTEVSFEEEYDDGETITADVPGFSTVDQQNWGIGAEYRFDMAGGTTEIDLDHARFDDQSMESEEAHARVDGEWDESEAERLDIDASDAETRLKLDHKQSLGAARMEDRKSTSLNSSH